MDVVLDSESVNSICRKPRKTKKQSGREDDLTTRVRLKLVRVVVDHESAILDEWLQGSNHEVVKALVVAWKDHGGFRLVSRESFARSKKAAKPVLKKAKISYSYPNQPMDNRLVATAMSTTDGVLVSSDSDFYDPSDATSLGNQAAPVATLLRTIGVTVITLRQLLDEIPVK
jgi:hypothetical protein